MAIDFFQLDESNNVTNIIEFGDSASAATFANNNGLNLVERNSVSGSAGWNGFNTIGTVYHTVSGSV